MTTVKLVGGQARLGALLVNLLAGDVGWEIPFGIVKPGCAAHAVQRIEGAAAMAEQELPVFGQRIAVGSRLYSGGVKVM